MRGPRLTALMFHLLLDFEWSVDPSYAPMDNHSLPFPKDGQPVELRRRSG